MNGIKNKLKELKLLIHDTHADIILIQETKVTPKAKQKHPKKCIPSPPCVLIGCTKQEVCSLLSSETTLHSLQQTYLRPIIHTTQNFKGQHIKHINSTKHITIANIYIPPRDSSSTHYKTADTVIQHCIHYITNIQHSVLTGDVIAHSTLWHSYTDDHRGKLITGVISNSDYITLNTNTPTRVPNTTLQQTSSPDITTVSNILYNRTSWTTQLAMSSDHLPIITTINIRHDYRL